ncbi:MAG: hypothetical protein HZA50_17755 [Planctomycetes bacterium]|nr:hypothetical protein [Planctomycetota bacterium]
MIKNMGIKGLVAICNMGLICLAIIAYMIFVPEDKYLEKAFESGFYVATTIMTVVVVFSFPIGWLCMAPPFNAEPHFILDGACIFIPLNAYFWGWIAKKCSGATRK